MRSPADVSESPGPNGGDRRSAQREATRARLFEETVNEFSRRGVADTEIAVVTERVGVSRSAFYVHFTDKDDVLRELLTIEEQRIADEARPATERDARIDMLFSAVVDAVLAAERRMGRRLVRDLCAAQFRPEFARLLTVDDHPLGLMLVDQIAHRAPDVDAVDLAMVFLTGLFGLLATDDASQADRRRRLDLLVQLITEPGRNSIPASQEDPTMTSTLIEAPRPPMVASVPILGPLRPFLGDVLPFLTESRATYGDAFRLRMVTIELTCLCGPDAIALLQKDGGLRTSTSMHVLDEEMQSRLPSMIDGPNRQTIRKIHHQFMNHSLESTRRDDIQSWLDEHTQRWQPGVRLDVLSEAQTQTVDLLSRLLNGEPFPFQKRDLSLLVHTMIWATFGHAPRLILRNPAYRSAQKRIRAHLLELVAKIRSDPAHAAHRR